MYDTFIDSFAAVLTSDPKVRNPRVAAIAFVGVVQGGAIQGLLRAGDPPVEALAEGCLDLLAEWCAEPGKRAFPEAPAGSGETPRPPVDPA